eukprot:278143_1
MSVSRICEPFCNCIGDHCPVSKTVLHITATIIWLGGVIAVNAKLVIYMMTVTQGNSNKYELLCLPDNSGNNRTWLPFAIGSVIAILQTPWIYKFVRRNYTRIEQLPINDSYIISQHKSCYECYFLSFMIPMLMSFVILDELLCGKDDTKENVSGAKCVFIGLDACVGLFLLFGLSGFIVSFCKGSLETPDYTQLIQENDDLTNASTAEINAPNENEPNTVI